jgi:hypothetical protein
VFVDGIDAMTSKAMQARRSYQPSEMAMNQQVGNTCLQQHKPARVCTGICSTGPCTAGAAAVLVCNVGCICTILYRRP